MSDTSDIKIMTLNQKTVFKTSAAIERVKIHNNSSFFLRVYFGADAPSDPGPGGGWHDTIDPGGTPLMAIVGASADTFANRSYVQSTPYQGVITVMPFLPVGTTSPIGVITGGALCYITGYYQGEWAQEGGEIEAYVQAAKQARYQAVLGASSVSIGNAIDYSLVSGVALGNPIVLSSATMPNLFSANAAGASLIQAYVFGFAMEVYMNLDFTGAHDPAFWEGFFAVKVVAAALAPTRGQTEFWHGSFYLAPPHFGGPVDKLLPINAGAAPINIPVSIPQGTLQNGDLCFISYNVTSQSLLDNSQWRGFTNGYFAIDTVNQTPLLAFPFPANPAWSLTNPQTY